MSLKIDRVQLEIVIGNDESRKRMQELEGDIRKAKNELSKMTKGTEEYNNQVKKIQAAQQEYDELIEKIGLANLSVKELTKRQKELNTILKNLSPNTAEFKEYSAQLQAVNAQLAKTQSGIKGTQSAFSSFGQSIGGLADKFNKFQGLALGFIAAFTGVAYSLTKVIKGNAELDDSLADIQKTTGMTRKEVEELNKQLGKIDTRTSRAELRNIATVAGQLGIAKGDVLKFTESIDKLNVALGDEFGGNAEAVATDVGKLRMVLSDSKTGNVADDLLRIGNALNTLGAEGAATSPVVLDFSNRIGGVGITLGLTSDEVLGLSATLQELNVNTERGGTAVVKILQKMTTDTETFAKVAGMELSDFTNLVNTDLFGAFQKVLEGSQKTGTSATALAGILDSLGVDGAGASEVFAKLGGNMGLLQEKVTVAGNALKGTDSIMSEFALKNENLAAKLEKIGKWFNSLFVSQTVTNGLRGLVSWFADLVTTTEKVSVSMEKERQQVDLLAMEMLDANTSAQRRNELYEELKSINPQIVEGLQKEALNYDILRQNLEKYNQEQINRIIIQRQQEKLDEQNIKVAEAREKILEKESELRKRVSDFVQFAQKYQIDGAQEIIKTAQNENFTLQQKAKLLDEIQVKNKRIFEGFNFRFILNDLESYTQSMNKAQDVSNLMIQERIQLEKDLGIELKKNETVKTPDSGNKTDDGTLTEEQKKAIEERKKAEKELADYISSLRLGMITDAQLKARMEIEIWREKELEKINISKASASKRTEAEKIIEDAYRQKLLQSEQDYNKKKEDILKQANAFIEQQTNSLKDKTLSNNEKEIQKVREKYDKQIELLKNYEDAKDQIEKLNFLKQEEINNLKLEQERKYQNEIFAYRKQMQVLSLSELMQAELKALEDNNLFKLLTIEEQELARQQVVRNSLETIKLMDDEKLQEFIDSEIFQTLTLEQQLIVRNRIQEIYNKKSIDLIGKLDSSYKQIYSAITNWIAGQYDNQYGALEVQKQKELQMVGDNTEARKQIEEKFAEKKLQIEKEQKEKSKRMAITQLIIDGILSVAKTFATFGYPAGIIPAAIAAGVTVAQIATVSAQQYAKGKYPVIGDDDGKLYNANYTRSLGTGIVYTPTLVAEQPEAVIDHRTLYNPKRDEYGMRAVDHFNAIKALKFGSVPQFAEGKYPSIESSERDQPNMDLMQQEFTDLKNAFLIYAQKVDQWASSLEVIIDYWSLKETDENIKKVILDSSY